MKKIIIVVVNSIIFITNYIIMTLFALGAFIDDYVEPISKGHRYLIFLEGVLIAIIIDLFVNYLLVKIFNKKEKQFKYLKVIVLPLVFTIIQSIIILHL